MAQERNYRDNPRRDAKPKKPGRSIAQKVIGEVVTVKIMNSNENRESVGKGRPGILLQEVGGQFDVMGLSKQEEYKTSGAARTPIIDHASLGLEVPSHYWGDRPTRMSRADIGDHIGWVTQAAIADMRTLGVELPEDAWTALGACAENHHPTRSENRKADQSADTAKPDSRPSAG